MHSILLRTTMALVSLVTVLSAQPTAAHSGGGAHAHPAGASIWSSELVGILSVALVVLIVYRLTSRHDRAPEESRAWQIGPALPGSGLDQPGGAAAPNVPARPKL